jgi:hypothetical protein
MAWVTCKLIIKHNLNLTAPYFFRDQMIFEARKDIAKMMNLMLLNSPYI